MAFVTLQPSSRGFVLVTLAVSLMWWACFFAVILQLRGVCANLSSGAPFQRDNIRRLRTMGWAILGTVGVELLIDAMALVYLHARVTVGGGPVVVPGVIAWVDFPLGSAIAGFAVLVLAEIFRAGASLQDDQALTI
jgi:predicted membrane channel-forming protein YqfA (hemolysin III family)